MGVGLAQSPARPGGNLTGVATVAPGTFLSKNLQLLRELLPTARRVAALVNPANEVASRLLARPSQRSRRGRRPLDVAAIRARTRYDRGSQPFTQANFARSIGVPAGTVRQWEQGSRQPTGAARVLLALIAQNPNIVSETLSPRD